MLTHLRATLSIHTNLEFPQPPTCVPCLPVSEPIDAGKDQQLPAISHDYQLFTFDEIPIDQRWRRDASTARNHQRQTNPTGTNNFLGTTAAGAIAGRTQSPSLLCFRNEREKKKKLFLSNFNWHDEPHHPRRPRSSTATASRPCPPAACRPPPALPAASSPPSASPAG